MLTAQSPIIAPSTATADQCWQWLTRDGRSHGEYEVYDIRDVIIPAYAGFCVTAGVNLAIAIAQLDIESDGLNSALSQRKDKEGRDLRNPAGIGVYEAKERATFYYRDGTVFDADVGGYRPACGFPTWRHAARAHIGRLVAWATVPGKRTSDQQALVDLALSVRPLPLKYQGSAPILIALGKRHNPQDEGWASPGSDYGSKIARRGNIIGAY